MNHCTVSSRNSRSGSRIQLGQIAKSAQSLVTTAPPVIATTNTSNTSHQNDPAPLILGFRGWREVGGASL